MRYLRFTPWFIAFALTAVGLGGCHKEAPSVPPSSASHGAMERASKAEPAAAARTAQGGGKALAAAAKEAPAKRTEVVLWHAYRGLEKKALEKLAARYNAEPHPAKVRLVAVPYDAFVDKITVTVPRGQGPDLFIFAHNLIGRWSELHILEPLSGRVPPDVLRRFVPKTVKALVYDGTLYGLPLAYKCLALFYNRAMVRVAPATVDALIEAAKRHTDAKAGHFGLAYEADKLYFHAPWLFGFGGRIFDEGGKLAVDTPEAVESLRFAKKLAVDSGIMPREVSGFLVTSLFNQGKLAFAIEGPWFRAEIAKGIDYAVAPLPALPGGRRPRPFLGSEAVFLSARSPHKDAAMDFASWLTSDEAARVRAVEAHQPVANRAVYGDKAVAADTAMAVFRKVADDAVLMPARSAMQVVWSHYDRALHKALYGGADPTEALREARQRIEHDLQRAEGK